MFEEYGPIMSVQNVCDELMVGKNTVYQLIKQGKISSFRTGRTWKINRDSLAYYIRRESGLEQRKEVTS